MRINVNLTCIIFILLAITNCRTQEKKRQDIEYENPELLELIEEHSVKNVFSKLKKGLFLGKNVGEFLDEVSNTGDSIQDIYFTNSWPPYYRQLALIELDSNYQIKLGFINGPSKKLFKVNMGNAKEIRNQKVDIIHLIYRPDSLSSVTNSLEIRNGKALRKPNRFKNSTFLANWTVDLPTDIESELTLLYFEKNNFSIVE